MAPYDDEDDWVGTPPEGRYTPGPGQAGVLAPAVAAGGRRDGVGADHPGARAGAQVGARRAVTTPGTTAARPTSAIICRVANVTSGRPESTSMPYAPDLSGCALDGRYELHAVIGEGAFGRVYSGRDRRLERPVAIKLIKPWWAEDPEWVQQLRARGAAAGAGQRPRDRPDLRRRPRRRGPLLRVRAGRWREPRRPPAPRAAAGVGGRRGRRAAVPRARSGARPAASCTGTSSPPTS